MPHRRVRVLSFAFFMLIAGCAQGFGVQTTKTQGHKTRHVRRARRIAWNPLFRGSHDSLLRQNQEIDRLQLHRIADDVELQELEARGELVPIEETDSLHVAPNLEQSRRYCRPWTRDFLQDLGDAYYREFKQPIQVNSAVRTIEQQKKLRRRNHNAAPETGEVASSHLAGLTVDITKRGMTRAQHQWMDDYLLGLRDHGLIEPEEERRQPVFHIMVSDRYTEWRQPSTLAPAKLEDGSQLSPAKLDGGSQ